MELRYRLAREKGADRVGLPRAPAPLAPDAARAPALRVVHHGVLHRAVLAVHHQLARAVLAGQGAGAVQRLFLGGVHAHGALGALLLDRPPLLARDDGVHRHLRALQSADEQPHALGERLHLRGELLHLGAGRHAQLLQRLDHGVVHGGLHLLHHRLAPRVHVVLQRADAHLAALLQLLPALHQRLALLHQRVVQGGALLLHRGERAQAGEPYVAPARGHLVGDLLRQLHHPVRHRPGQLAQAEDAGFLRLGAHRPSPLSVGLVAASRAPRDAPPAAGSGRRPSSCSSSTRFSVASSWASWARSCFSSRVCGPCSTREMRPIDPSTSSSTPCFTCPTPLSITFPPRRSTSCSSSLGSTPRPRFPSSSTTCVSVCAVMSSPVTLSTTSTVSPRRMMAATCSSETYSLAATS